MITILYGENGFERTRALKDIVATFGGEVERIDGESLSVAHLTDALFGTTLFSSERLVVVRDLSANKSVWDELGRLLERVTSMDTHVVLMEGKIDKRTKTFKSLQSVAEIREFKPFSERDTYAVRRWLLEQAHIRNLQLDESNAQLLIDLVGIDQWRLDSALQKLSLAKSVSAEVIKAVIELTPQASAFGSFTAAIKGDGSYIQKTITELEQLDDPYRTWGLLSGQMVQLAALVTTNQSPDELAGSIGAHPYALKQLVPLARGMNRSDVRALLKLFSDTDYSLKSSGRPPWQLIEQTLLHCSVDQIK